VDQHFFVTEIMSEGYKNVMSDAGGINWNVDFVLKASCVKQKLNPVADETNICTHLMKLGVFLRTSLYLYQRIPSYKD